MKIGVLLDSLQLPLDSALDYCISKGVDGIQFFVTGHPMAFRKPTQEEVFSVVKRARLSGLEIPALCGDIGGHGFEPDFCTDSTVALTSDILKLASALEVPIVSTHIGVIPDSGDKRSRMIDLLNAVCREASSLGVCLAVETGPEKSADMKQFIIEVSEPSLKVNFDPANLVMIHHENAAEAVEVLSDYIVHVHAKDGTFLKPCIPKVIYDAFADGNPEGIVFDAFFREEALGEGEVAFPTLIDTLRTIGYTGFLTIERESGINRIADITKAIDFLRGRGC